MSNATMKTYQYEGCVNIQFKTNATSIEEAQEKMTKGEGELTFVDYDHLWDDHEQTKIREVA